MLEIGKYNRLRVKSSATVGLYLTNGEEDVLLPTKYIPENTSVGDLLDVFVYLDNENRPVATTLKPYACVGDFAFLSVKQVNEHGAFLDWGIAKDVFVPYAEQRVEMETGERYLVYLLIDEFSGRIAATAKWSKYLHDASNLQEGQEVQLLIAEKTPLGFKAIINNECEGLLYENEIFTPIQSGDKIKGFVRLVREDGKVDLRLQQEGVEAMNDAKSQVLSYLRQNGGVLALGDKSSPEEIYRQLQMSKKNFKKAIGGLYKDQLISLSDHEIRLLELTEE
ncbi:MAG TPA: S1-like domain-containing RNA-binding protein [Bacteroidia bacterium]|nr:S1-like domain-containing RNA-binding protein [Bacteroidia bacterium]